MLATHIKSTTQSSVIVLGFYVSSTRKTLPQVSLACSPLMSDRKLKVPGPAFRQSESFAEISQRGPILLISPGKHLWWSDPLPLRRDTYSGNQSALVAGGI